MMKLSPFLALLFVLVFSMSAQAGESYAGVEISDVPNWSLQQMQTFSGTVPSRAWIFGKNDEEVAVSAMVTEGIENGLKDQDLNVMAKTYVDALVTGWGGEPKGDALSVKSAFCGGEFGYKAEAKFGDRVFDYYGCLLMNPERSRIITVVTWGAHDIPEEIVARRLMTFIQASSFPPADDE